MFWVQALTSFALWIGYGIYKARNSTALRLKLLDIPRGRRPLYGAGLMILGSAVLFGVLLLAFTLGGFTQNGMSALAWIAVAVAGLVFVHCQMLSMAMLVTLVMDGGVTSREGRTSDQKESESRPIEKP